MKNSTSLIGGLAGAIALNLLHETARRFFSSAPRIDKIGEQALSKSLASAGIQPPSGKKLFGATLAADVISNAVYYSLLGAGKPKHLLLRGAAAGLIAGIGAVKLPEPMGLDDRPVNKNATSSLLTVGYYVFGGLVAAAAISLLKKEKTNKKKLSVDNAIL
jgi:hypothetical protein